MNDAPPEKMKSVIETLQLEPVLVATSTVAGLGPEATSNASPATIITTTSFSPTLAPSTVRTTSASAPTFSPATVRDGPPASVAMASAPTVARAPVEMAPDATAHLSAALVHGLATTQAATPVSTPALTPKRRTVQLSVEELLALFRPMPRATPAPVASAPVAPPRAQRFLLWGVVAALVLGGASYAATHALLVRNTRWVAPTVLSKSDPRVLQLSATLQQETSRKSELLLRKKELEARARDTADWIELEAGFQASFMAALKNDLDGQRAELRRVQKLLADRDAAAVAASAEDAHPELDARLATVRQRVRMLEGALRGGRAGTYEALALRREYDRSVLEAAKARELQDTLARSVAEVDDQLKKKDALLASIDASPYRLAIDADTTLGFVPYENAASVVKGQPLIACKTSLLFCDRVGEVGDGLSGEVRGIHPVTGVEVRGQLVRLELAPGRAVPDSVLYAGKPPLSL